MNNSVLLISNHKFILYRSNYVDSKGIDEVELLLALGSKRFPPISSSIFLSAIIPRPFNLDVYSYTKGKKKNQNVSRRNKNLQE